MSASLSHPLSFDDAAKALELDMLDYLFDHHPGEQCRRMTERIKLTAKLLARCTGLQLSKALDAVAQAVRFRHWHELSTHLARGEHAQPPALTKAWLDALSAAVVLMVVVEDDVTLPPAQLAAFEQLGQTLAMLTDTPKQVVLDAVPARLCAGGTWAEVCSRSPLKSMAPLYSFVATMLDEDEDVGGVRPRQERQMSEQELRAQVTARGGVRLSSAPCRRFPCRSKDAPGCLQKVSGCGCRSVRAWCSRRKP